MTVELYEFEIKILMFATNKMTIGSVESSDFAIKYQSDRVKI